MSIATRSSTLRPKRMGIFESLASWWGSAVARAFPGPTPAEDELNRELKARQIRAEVPLHYHARTIGATEKAKERALIYFRDQLDAGVDPQLALYRAKGHMCDLLPTKTPKKPMGWLDQGGGK